MKSRFYLFALFVFLTPNIAQAYAASGGAIIEFFSICILIPFGGVIFYFTNFLKLKTPLVLHVALALIVLLSIIGILGMIWSLQTEVGYRPIVLGMHALLIICVLFAAKHIIGVYGDS